MNPDSMMKTAGLLTGAASTMLNRANILNNDVIIDLESIVGTSCDNGFDYNPSEPLRTETNENGSSWGRVSLVPPTKTESPFTELCTEIDEFKINKLCEKYIIKRTRDLNQKGKNDLLQKYKINEDFIFDLLKYITNTFPV